MEKRENLRYNSKSYIAVLDRNTNKPIGHLVNLSKQGAMLLTADSVKIKSKFSCKIELDKPIMDCDEIWFEATCCWCRKNIKSDLWESGYKLKTSGKDLELISYLSLSFVLDHLESPGIKEPKIVQLENRRYNTRYEPKNFFPVLAQQNSVQIGEIVDISQGGIMMITESPHEKGSIVEYRAKLPKRIFQRDYLFFKAECRWVSKDEHTGKYKIGLKFISLSQQDSVIILHLIIHHLNECSSTNRVKVI